MQSVVSKNKLIIRCILMKDILTRLMEKIYINQNFIWLIFFYFGVWFADVHDAEYLCKASWILFIASGISVIICLIAYTIGYCKKKLS